MTFLVRITRRDFLLQLGVGTGSLVFGSCFSAAGRVASMFQHGIPINPFVAIKPVSGDIIVISHRSETGQGIKSSLVAVLVDEMEADWHRVVLRQADANSYSYGIPFPLPVPEAEEVVRSAEAQITAASTASIERCPVANGRLVDFDPKPALAVPGVRKVMRVLAADAPTGGVGAGLTPYAGVAVLATNTWASMKGRAVLRPTIRWDGGGNRDHDSTAQRIELETAAGSQGRRVRWKGDVDAAFADAVRTVEARYYVPHLAQVPMEPPVAVVHFRNGRVEAWAPTQNPDATQQAIGRAVFNIPPSRVDDAAVTEHIRQNVTLHVTLLGGGFGRKLHPDSRDCPGPGVSKHARSSSDPSIACASFTIVRAIISASRARRCVSARRDRNRADARGVF